MELVALFLLTEAMLSHSRINGLPVDKSDHFPFYLMKTYSQNDTQLHLSRMNISNIPVNAFQSFSALEILELSHNNLTYNSLPCGSLTITTLRHLNLASNQLTRAPSCLPTALKFLDLSKNVIHQVEFSQFMDLHNLNILLLSHNKISKIVSSGTVLPDLASLDLSYNNFTRLQWKFQGPNLTMLRLEGNPLQEISPYEFSPFPKLHYLNLSSTSLESCSYKAFASETENIEILDLSENLFKTLDPQCFEGLSNLQILRMRRIPCLQTLPGDLFLYTSSLIHVDLEENPQLHFVKSSMFEQLLHLQTLSLKSCNLTEFRPWKFFTNSTITITLSGNHLVCSCELTWLIKEPEKISLNRMLENGELLNFARHEKEGDKGIAATTSAVADAPSPDTVREGHHVVLKRDEVFKAVQVQRRRKIIFEKQWFYLDNAIGHKYGTTFEVSIGGALQQLKAKSEDIEEPNEAGVDNRNIIDDGKSQKLSRDDIEALKEQGLKGQAIVQHLVENSTTFRDKTEFSQEKYIKKKKKKYEAFITILKPTARVMAMMYHCREPGKICHLRYDTLAQMLAFGNIHAGCKVIVVETCAGLVLGSVMERLGGYGSVVHMYPGSMPIRAAMENFGFPKSFYDHLYDFPINKLNSLSGRFSAENETLQNQTCVVLGEGNRSPLSTQQGDEVPCAKTMMDNNQVGETEANDVAFETESKDKNADGKSNVIKRKSKQEGRLKKLQAAAAVLQERNADGLIIASRLYPSPLLLSLLEFVAPSRPFVIYCQYKEPLLTCYADLRKRGGVINLRLSETWLRGYQVLPNRTHPKLTMSGGGGYILTGITVAMDGDKSVAVNPEPQEFEDPRTKRQKVEESIS